MHLVERLLGAGQAPLGGLSRMCLCLGCALKGADLSLYVWSLGFGREQKSSGISRMCIVLNAKIGVNLM